MKADFSKFQNCLRIQLIPDKYADERIKRLLAHCKKFGFSNVIFLTNGEDFFLGHVTVEEIKPWVEVIKKAAEVLRDNGIGVSLHHWHNMGHADRGIGLKDGQNFTTMVDFNGKRSISIACPIDENWHAHFSKLLGYMIREIRPDYYWVEDDFRLHNHAPLEWVGCFCEKHMQRFNKLLDTKYTRAEFCEKAFQKGTPTKETKVWLDGSKKTMLDLAALIYKIVKEANSSTEIALMTSTPSAHCVEARDWTELFEIFSGGGDKLNRIHLPGYYERAGKEYMYQFNVISMAIRALSPLDTKILPEMENGPISSFRKTPRFFGFQLEAALPLCLSGMTYNIYDNIGNGPLEEYGFANEMQRLNPYMQAVMDTGVRFSDLKGVVIPLDEKIDYYKKIENNHNDLTANIFNVGGYVSALGLSYRYSKQKEFNGETVFLFDDAVYIFTDDQLRALFANNYVVVDGGAALLLKERGLLDLIGATDAKLYESQTGYQAYEEIIGKKEIFNIKGFRASCRKEAGDFVRITYKSTANVKILSCVRKADGTITWDSFVQGENFLVNPFVINKMLYTQFSELRRRFVLDFVEEKAKVLIDAMEGINPYLYQSGKESVVMLVNGTLDNFEQTEFFIKGIDFDKIVAIHKDGANKEVGFKKLNDKLVIDYPLPYMSTSTFKLIKE